MEKRPLSLTIIAWLMILSAIFALYSSLTMSGNPIASKMLAESPLPLSAHIAFGAIGSLVTLACGYGVLKGFDWSRWLYVGWSLAGFVFSLLTVPIMSILAVSLIFFAVIVFFLPARRQSLVPARAGRELTLRRALSVILFILGAWLLAAEVMMAWISVGQSGATELGMIGVMLAFCAPLLLLGMWAGPGNRFIELGRTIMIAAAVGATLALVLFILLADPSFTRLMPPDNPAPNFKISWVSGLLNLALVAGAGWLLFRFGRRQPPPA